MKLIFEVNDGVQYLYFETEKHFRKTQKQRELTQETVSLEQLKYECNVSECGDNFHIVFDNVKPQKKKKV